MYMKRVAVIAIFMAVMASLFAFPVFADTPVQPLQVVTYSDTTTNVRISGTAERLHYNIDSFQVIFMNPPNNYGTSCTPLLISFRFYNASDIPAYVGQAEFELTATSGTGSINTIIYGYDQISTDLFVSESSYSTAEVGRIGIGASNDFAYYTGFVIPPRTSLYFSCIVYVNASAYAQNNTGATEDVNQVTLSALNLYTNQISFSEDYPYHNQPIDFEPIISAIGDLADTVSTSTEMRSLIDAITYTGSNPDFSSSSGIFTSVYHTHSTLNYRMDINRYIGPSSKIDRDFELNSGNDSVVQTFLYKTPFYIKINIRNNEISPIRVYWQLYPFNLLPTTQSNSIYIELFQSDVFSNIQFFYTQSNLELKIKYGHNGVIPSGTTYCVISGYVLSDVIPSFPTMSITDSSMTVNSPLLLTNQYYPIDEYSILRDLYIAYSSVNGLDDIDDAAEDITDKSESAHTQEQSYFTQNAQAIQQTGLSNYRFNGDQENGIGSVSHDFTLLWNSLGGFNSVYIFSLTLSLALMILRHAPGAIKSSRRNKEE